MRNRLFCLSACVCLIAPLLEAGVSKGHRLFKANCRDCHGKAFEFVTGKTTDQWGSILSDGGKTLRDFHVKSKEAQPSLEYFNTPRYDGHVSHYRDFFLEYAGDTGNIPACE